MNAAGLLAARRWLGGYSPSWLLADLAAGVEDATRLLDRQTKLADVLKE
jgi:hypothetical protein